MTNLSEWTESEKLYKATNLIKQVVEVTSMKRSDFSHVPTGDIKYPTNEREVNAFIKERTRLWRETWIESPLVEALEILDSITPSNYR